MVDLPFSTLSSSVLKLLNEHYARIFAHSCEKVLEGILIDPLPAILHLGGTIESMDASNIAIS